MEAGHLCQFSNCSATSFTWALGYVPYKAVHLHGLQLAVSAPLLHPMWFNAENLCCAVDVVQLLWLIQQRGRAFGPIGENRNYCTMVMLAALLKLMVLLWRNGMIRG